MNPLEAKKILAPNGFSGGVFIRLTYAHTHTHARTSILLLTKADACPRAASTTGLENLSSVYLFFINIIEFFKKSELLHIILSIAAPLVIKTIYINDINMEISVISHSNHLAISDGVLHYYLHGRIFLDEKSFFEINLFITFVLRGIIS